MKAGLSDALKRRLHRPGTLAKLYVDAIVRKGEDVRQRRDEWNNGTLTNVDTFDDGAVRLHGSSASKISSTTSDSFVTSLGEGRPLDILAYELDEGIGANPYLTKVQAYLTRQQNGGLPRFDGSFTCQIFRVARIQPASAGADIWQPVAVTDPISVAAQSMSGDTVLVDFAFSGNGPYDASSPPWLVIGEQFRPIDQTFLGVELESDPINGRLIVVVIGARGGTNTNYGLGKDSTLATKITTGGAGTLRHRIASANVLPNLANWWAVSDTASGMTRATIQLGTFSATGTIAFTGSNTPGPPASGKMDTGLGSVQGAIEFVVRGEVPAGTALVASARVLGTDPWVAVKDGQAPADVGLAASSNYEMKADFTANGGQDATPVLRVLGIVDRVSYDLTDQCDLQGFDQSVDPLTSKVKMSEGHCIIAKMGVRDYRDLATQLFSENDFTSISFRVFVGAPDLTRDQFLFLDEYRVDDYDDQGERIDVTLIDVLSELRGKFPVAGGQLYGYFLKSEVSDLSGGAAFNQEMSESAETTGTIAVSIGASTSKTGYAFTRPNVPNFGKWFTPGDWVQKVNVTTPNSNIYLKIAIARINAGGSLQEGSAGQALYTTPEQQCNNAGVLTFSLAHLVWALGTATDRLRVEYIFRNAAGSTQSVTIGTGDLNTETQAPWTAQTQKAEKVYSGVSINAAYTDWVNSQVGLAERWRGAPPSNTTDIVTKTVYDQDGKDELERIAFLDGGCPIGTQGKVQFASLARPNAAVAAFFPLEETKPTSFSPGFKSRMPVLDVPYGYYVNGQDFQGHVHVVHATALSKFGQSKIDNPNSAIGDDIAKWIPTPQLAQSIGEPMVRSMGCGFIVWRFGTIIPRPELDIGDAVAVETDRFTVRNPNTGDVIKGELWGVGRIIEKTDIWGRGFGVWIRSYADLFVTGDTVQKRAPADLPIIQATVKSITGQPQNAVVSLSVYPASATLKYFYGAASATIPDKSSDLWTSYSAPVTVARDAALDNVFSFYGSINGINGPVLSVVVPHDSRASIGALTGAQSGTSPNITVTVTASAPSENCKSIRYYGVDHATNWPTLDNTSTGILDETKFLGELGVQPDWGGITSSGASTRGGLLAVQVGTTFATSDHAHIIAVPLDAFNNPGVRSTLDFTVAGGGGATPALSSTTVAEHTAGSAGPPIVNKTVDFAWTPNSAVTDGTHVLWIFETINGVRSSYTTVSNPHSVTSLSNQDSLYYPKSLQPDVAMSFDYELRNGSTVVATGTFTPYPFETFQGLRNA